MSTATGMSERDKDDDCGRVQGAKGVFVIFFDGVIGDLININSL